MSRLFEFGRFGKVYVGWHYDEPRRRLDCWRVEGEWYLAVSRLEVIVTPPWVMRGERSWEIV